MHTQKLQGNDNYVQSFIASPMNCSTFVQINITNTDTFSYMTKIRFIVNPISGTKGKKKIIKQIEAQREKLTDFDIEICQTEYAGHAYQLASDAVKKGCNIVVAIGGDGTINEIGRALVHTDIALGIIPCGSGNGLARHLRIPLDAKGALEVIFMGKQEDIDYGKIDGHPFFCTCGVGFDAFVSMTFAKSGKRGPLSYLENTLTNWLSYKPETYELIDEHGSTHHKAFLIACANASQYGNNAYIAPHASLSDGELDIIILEPFTALEIPTLSFQLFNRMIDQNSHIKQIKGKKITIRREKEGVYHFDGDPVVGGKDLEVVIIPKGLKVVVPATDSVALRIPNVKELFSEFISKNNIAYNLPDIPQELKKLNKQLIDRLSPKKKE